MPSKNCKQCIIGAGSSLNWVAIVSLHLSKMLAKIFSRRNTEIFLCIFPRKTGFDISCKLSPICMKYQILFSGEK